MRPSRRRCCPQRVWGFESIEMRLLMALGQPADFSLDYIVESPVPQDTGGNTLALQSLTGLSQTQAAYGFTGRGQTVAIIDSGIAYSHTALGDGLGSGHRVVGGWDFAENDADPYDDGPAGSHGTHVAGILASTDSSCPGIAPGADLVALRVFDDSGQGNFHWVEQALQWVHDHRNSFPNPITTVNLSLGANWNADSLPSWSTLEDELAQLDADGIFVAVAAGNSFAQNSQVGLDYPAVSSHVVPVASVDANGSLSYFSQRSPRVIAAPGRNVLSTVPDYLGNHDGVDNDFARFSGTSMATPYVSGAAVLLREAYQFAGYANVTEKTLYDLMVNTADTVYDPQTGQNYHRLNIQRAVDAIAPADDFGSTVATADQLGAIADTRTVSGAIGRRDDSDWFTFVAGRTGTATFTAAGAQEMVAAWDPNCNIPGATVAADGSLSFHVVAGQSYTVGLMTGAGVGHYTLQASLKTAAADRANWGTLSQGQFNDYRIDTAGQWFTFTAANSGPLSVQAQFTSAAGDVDLQLFDASGTLVGGSYGSGDVEQIDLTATAGQAFRLHAYAYGDEANEHVNFQILGSTPAPADPTVRLQGTSGNDQFSLSADATAFHVVLNGVTHDYSRATVSAIIFDGQGGNDTAVLQGTGAAETATFHPGSVDWSGSGDQVQLTNVEQITLHGGGGADQLTVYDSAGDDVLVAMPSSVRMTGTGYSLSADGFANVHAYATAGGNDTAKLYDSAGDDTFTASPQTARFSGRGFDLQADGFAAVTAFATAGGNDTATLYDSPGNDTFLATPTYGTFYGDGFYVRAKYFDSVHAIATAGGNDTARLYDSTGDDTFVGTPA